MHCPQTCQLVVFTHTDGASGTERLDFIKEIELMKKIADGNNSHVVNMVGCVTIQEPMFLITEFVKHGDLQTFLRTCRKQVRSSHPQNMMCMLSIVCMYMSVYVYKCLSSIL